MGQILSKRAVVCRLKISCPTGKRVDKPASVVVEDDFHAHRGVSRVVKNIFGDGKEIRKIMAACAGARRRLRHISIPHPIEDGAFIVPDGFPLLNFMKKYDQERQKITGLVKKFCEAYEQCIAKAKIQLGDLFKESDYPQDIISQFECRLSIVPIADSDQFDALDTITEGLKARYELEMEEVQERAVEELLQRLIDVVQTTIMKFKEFTPEGRFYASWVTAPMETAQIARSLNITGDPRITSLCDCITQAIGDRNAQEFRENLYERMRATADLQACLNTILQ